MSFIETLQKVRELTKDIEIEYSGEKLPFVLIQMTTTQQFELGGMDQNDPNTLAKTVRYGVQVGEASDEQILQLPVEVINKLSVEILEFNGLKVEEQTVVQSEPLPEGAADPNS